MRRRLIKAAHKIAANRNDKPVSKLVALRKIFIQERRDWKRGGVQVGWKRGELTEVLQALASRSWDEALEEWGDIGYYLAQSYDALWWLYEMVTPKKIVTYAVMKFERRARSGY